MIARNCLGELKIDTHQLVCEERRKKTHARKFNVNDRCARKDMKTLFLEEKNTKKLSFPGNLSIFCPTILGILVIYHSGDNEPNCACFHYDLIYCAAKVVQKRQGCAVGSFLLLPCAVVTKATR